ncbi:MAG: DUF58 domain-containing protein [Opitutaceae bacterium]|jgi:hypothetical protein
MTPPVLSLHTSAFSRLRRLEWRVRHAVENVLSGEYRSTFRGRGMEFDQVVKYEFGDDVRDIDWNVTARLGEPYRKKFVEEREVTLLLIVEDSTSLQFGSGAVSKREALMELAGLVMLLGAVNRDRVGYLLSSPEGYEFRPPVRGRGQIMHLAATLVGRPPPPLANLKSQISNLRSQNSEPRTQIPDSQIPWRILSKSIPRHSIVLWLSDFPPRPAPEGWAVLQRRYQTMGFRIDDPWDRSFPDEGFMAAYDPIGSRLVTLEGSTAERNAHAAWRNQREAAWEAMFPDTFSRLAVSTEDDRLDALVRFFHARMNRTRNS